MLSYSVYEPPNPPADRLDRATELLFLKDGFSWTAALFSPLWLLGHRLWWQLLGYLALLAVLLGAGEAFAVQRQWIVLGIIALHIAVGLESAPLRTWSLTRRRWKNLGAVTGKSLAECERRFVTAWLPNEPVLDLGGPKPASDRRSRWSAFNPFASRL